MKYKRLAALTCSAAMLWGSVPMGIMPDITGMIVAEAIDSQAEGVLLDSVETDTGFVFEIYGSNDKQNQYAVLSQYKGNALTVTVPAEINSVPVTVIGKNAFSENYDIIAITLPDSITSIEESAFYSMSGLVRINVPDSVTSIGDGAFSCTGIVKIVLPDSISVLGEGVFSRCYSLSSVKLPDKLTKIPENTFCTCESLTSIEIPESVTVIEGFAFSSCSSLHSVKLPASLLKIGQYAFQSCGLSEISIPDSVATIEEEVFSNCLNLEEVRLPSSLISIKRSAFYHCPIKEIYLPESLVNIEETAFDTTNLEKVTIPEGVGKIGDFAFPSETTIYGFSGSAAELYAAANGNKFIAISEYPTEKKVTTAAVYGDLNGDNAVDILDVISINKFQIGANELSPEAQINADVNLDTEINATDALLILKRALGVIDTLPYTT